MEAAEHLHSSTKKTLCHSQDHRRKVHGTTNLKTYMRSRILDMKLFIR
jgi:hypothetical protein